ncbi:Rrf2 family transcriptional regulator [soil metagenome]
MKFSTQEDYGLRCLLQIAGRPLTETALTIPEISRLEGLSQTHVAKLLMILRQGGFVRSSRGQAGGYRMAREAGEITVGEVLEALGGKLYDSDFCERHSGQLDVCTHAVDCGVRSLWQNVQKAVDAVVDRITVADLVGPQINLPEKRFEDRTDRIPLFQ